MRGWAIWLLGAAVGAPTSAWAADWYVAPGGVNGGAGSEASPLATVEHAVSRASAGDTIHLQRGGEYPVVGLTVSGMELAAYGAGPAPILTASTQVSLPDTWGMNANVRTGPVTEEVLAVYVDGRFVRRARYPNTGFLRIDNDDDPDTIVDAELADRPGVAAGRWTGAQVRWRRWSWWWETRPITDHSDPTTLHLGPDELLVAAKIDMNPDLDFAGVVAAINVAEKRVRAAVPSSRLCYLEPDRRRAQG